MAIASLEKNQLIIRKGWLKKYRGQIDLFTDELIFRPGHCSHQGADLAHEGTRALPEGITSGKAEREATQRKILRRPRQAELGLNEIKEAFPKTEKENSPGKDTSEPLKKASKKKKKKKRS